MKGKSRWLVVLACMAVLAVGGMTFWEYQRTAPLGDEEGLSRCVQGTYGWRVDEIHALEEDQGVAALLTTAKEGDSQAAQMVMFLFERSWLPGRYWVAGSATGTSPWGDYRYADSERAITVVYGDNRETEAHAYLFAIGNRLYGQQDLGDYALGLFVTSPSPESAGAVHWYDGEGNEISLEG